MPSYGDHDGKSRTASAVDEKHYPEQDSAPSHEQIETGPTHEQIAQLAYRLWLEQGSPENAAARNWMEAEEQLRNAGDSQSLIRPLHEKAGSVQP